MSFCTRPSLRRVRGVLVTALFLAPGSAAASAQGSAGLTASSSVLCVPNGASVGLELDAGAAHAGDVYLVLGSASGTAPGLLLDGQVLPLNPDGYFGSSLAQANEPALFPNTFGLLDGRGRAAAGIALPAGDDLASLAGLRLDFAFLAADVAPSGAPFTSNPVGITLEAAPSADFVATGPTAGAPPLFVSFDNLTQNPATFLWDFGDGTTSTATNPSKVYDEPGTYTVRLTATGPCGADVETKPAFVEVAPTFGDVYAILQAGNQCLSCHVGASPGGGLGYDTRALAYVEMVGVPSACSGEKLVIPFDAANSFLVKKVREATFGAPNACGLPMPFAGLPGSALAPGEVATIEAWIASGAPNN